MYEPIRVRLSKKERALMEQVKEAPETRKRLVEAIKVDREISSEVEMLDGEIVQRGPGCAGD